MCSANAKITFLDCTLRDGGYYNNWDFSDEFIQEYIYSMASACIDIVEIGYRNFTNVNFKGACAYSTDEFINQFDVPKSVEVGVMINGSDLRKMHENNCSLSQLFPNSVSDSRVKIVRIACNFKDYLFALEAAEWLTSRDIKVGINLMQIQNCTDDQIHDFATMASSKFVEVLYFADSLGQMIPSDITRIYSFIRERWKGNVGIHTHDNMGYGLLNSISAVNEGVNWVDSTIMGMGRGAGNTATEELLIHLKPDMKLANNLLPLLKLISKRVATLKAKYNWGTNAYYCLAAKQGIHPSYIQEIINDPYYSNEDLIAIIEYLSKNKSISFQPSSIKSALTFYNSEAIGTWQPETIMNGKDILILGSGPSLKAHQKAVESYIKRYNPLTLMVNFGNSLDDSLIDLRVSCHPIRLLSAAYSKNKVQQKLIAPFSMLDEILKKNLAKFHILDYGLSVQESKLLIEPYSCTLPSSLVLAYSIAIGISGKASSIYLAGFDGFPFGDSRNESIESLILSFKSGGFKVPISLTPSNYKNLSVNSIYGF